MASFTVNWSHIFPVDVDGTSHAPTFKLEVANVQVTLSGAGLEQHLLITLAQLQCPEPRNEEKQGEVNCGLKGCRRAVFGAGIPQLH